jgi:DNA (cytosine-5)-methyltransferase 1
MRYGSVCSGVEAASVAWEPLGFDPVFFSEIEPFPSAVLSHHWPSVPNHGDMTQFEGWNYEQGSIDILVGGTPCQSFSVAGLRGGIADSRGNLALTYCRMVDRLRPRWCVWENVPGVLSSGGGRDFGSILGAMAQLGYSCAWRVLDAKNFGVPQRRRRVFLVGCSSGDWRDPASVLFESGCGGRDFEKSRKEKQEDAKRTKGSIAYDKQRLGEYGSGNVASTIAARDYKDATDLVVHANNVAPSITSSVPPYSRTGNERVECDALVVQSKSVHEDQQADVRLQDCFNAVTTGGGKPGQGYSCLFNPSSNYKVRRLTPVEAERLQGFPDGHTDIGWKGKPTPDSHRYKAMGNSMAVPVMRWIGQRIKEHDA